MDIPVIICGGGVLGLLVAHELRNCYPDLEFALLEKEGSLGDHTSGRNSGVLHAGIYYPTESLKRELCIEGNQLWRKIGADHNITINTCGKYVIASSENELDALKNVFEQAMLNKVRGISKITDKDKEKLSPFCHVADGFFSETTAVLSPSEAISRLSYSLERKGSLLLRNHKVLSVKKQGDLFHLETNQGPLKSKYFFNLSGGHGPILRQGLGLHDIESVFVKGNYLKLNKSFYNESLIYPVPPSDLKGLGVHTSFDLDGIIRFGPDTESTSEAEDYEQGEGVIDQMFPAIEKIFKGITKEDLSLDYAGVRPKILKEKKPFNDFIIQGPSYHGILGYFETLGIESPGFTAAPAIAKRLVSLLKIV